MKTVRIADGKVVEILDPIPGFTLAECFHPSVLAACVAVEDSVSVGDDWPPPVVEPVAESVAEPVVEPVAETPIVTEPIAETPADPAADQPPAEPATV